MDKGLASKGSNNVITSISSNSDGKGDSNIRKRKAISLNSRGNSLLKYGNRNKSKDLAACTRKIYTDESKDSSERKRWIQEGRKY